MLFAWGLSTLILATWIQAAIHPTGQITISVNAYGELWWEAIVLPAAWLLITWYLLHHMRRIRRAGKRDKRRHDS